MAASSEGEDEEGLTAPSDAIGAVVGSSAFPAVVTAARELCPSECPDRVVPASAEAGAAVDWAPDSTKTTTTGGGVVCASAWAVVGPSDVTAEAGGVLASAGGATVVTPSTPPLVTGTVFSG